MGTGNDSILDAYLYETNTLLEQLDHIVLASEEKDTFSEEDINSIFRIMHTVKGSSAMMEYNSLMTIAHRAEDLFAIIRDKTMDVVPEALRPELFDLLFQTIDFFRQELEHIENECVCVIADGAAIGPEMDRLYKCALKKKIILTAESISAGRDFLQVC